MDMFKKKNNYLFLNYFVVVSTTLGSDGCYKRVLSSVLGLCVGPCSTGDQTWGCWHASVVVTCM